MPTIILALAVGLPILLMLVLRSDAGIVFLSLCAGTVLLRFVGDNAVLAADTVVPGGDPSMIARLTLLLAPPVLASFILRKSVSSSKMLYNLLPAVGVGLSAVLLVSPLLPFGAQSTLADSPFWDSLTTSQDLILGGTTLAALLNLWLLHHRSHGKGHKKGH